MGISIVRNLGSSRASIYWLTTSVNRYTSIRFNSNSASSDTAPKPIDLEFSLNEARMGVKSEGALIILHGLLGSKRNFTTLAKEFALRLDTPVYSLDLRNQGHSPHVRPMNYTSMAEDVLHFIHKHNLKNISLLGHSMGGKVAMSVALHPSLSLHENNHILSNLIVADVAPTRAKLSPEFQGYVEAMKKIESAKVTSRKEAMYILEEYEKDPTVRAFLLTNLHPITKAHPYATFRVPLDILDEAIPEIGSFPYAPGEKVWEGRVQFIKGARSAYINRHGLPVMKLFFPNMRLDTLEAGHWVHGEQPVAFSQLVTDFVHGNLCDSF